jgi:outer membrane receptor protein involved in Fe transport
MNLSPLSRALLRAGTCAAGLAAATPVFAAADLSAQPQAAAAPQAAQEQEEDEPETASGSAVSASEIIVSGNRIRGQLLVEQAPLLQLDEQAIAAEGVTSITDLIAQISAQTGSARGRGGDRPVILVNGIRIGSFREFASYPPEALARVEVFPEEVAQRFGFPPDRRVINLILKENYSNREVELEFEAPSRGGYMRTEQDFGTLRIADGGRFNLDFEFNDASLLTEDERDIIQTPGSVSAVPGDPEQARFRSLTADTFGFEGNLSWAKALIDSGTALSLNLNYQRNESRSLDGLNTVVLTDDPQVAGIIRTFGEDTPLARRSSTDRLSTAGSLTKPVNAFRLTTTFDASLAETETEIDRRFDTAALREAALDGSLAIDGPLPTDAEAGFDVARSRSITGQSQTTLEGPLAQLPAGELLATFNLGLDWQRIESRDTRSLTEASLTRRQLATGANVVVPLTSRRAGVADALGTFTLNLQAGVQDLSDFGVLGDWNAGLNWSPFDNLDLSATYIWREVAPGLAALGNPIITNFNVPVFDFSRGETVLADVTTGGNPDLPAETQRDWKFAANWQLPFWDNSRLTVEYIRNRSDNVVSGFPQITPEIEAAFPGRVTRDATGRLTAVDRRSVSFAETRANRVQFIFSTNGSIGGSSDGAEGGGRRGGGGGAAPTPAPAPAPAPAAGGARFGAGAAPSPEQREQFTAFRTRLCADDGLEFLQKLAAAIDSGADISAEFPGVDPARLAPMLARLRGEDGKLDPARLASLRTRICSVDPAMFAGRGQGAAGTPGGEGAPGEAPRFSAFRERACGPEGEAAIRELIGKIERGEDVSAELPGVDPAFIKMAIDRSRAPDGTIPPEALAQFKERFCAAAPQQAGGGAPAGGGGPAFNPLAGRSFPGFRYFVNVSHVIELDNEILIAEGLAPLDQLGGQATGAFGLPRHTSRLEAGLFGKGVGFRLSGIYTGETRLDGSGLPGSTDLFFDDIVTFNLRIFANMGELTGEGFLKDTRVSLRADNLFDAQRRVRDSSGETPINYQPFVIDPVGLYLGIDLRKLF